MKRFIGLLVLAAVLHSNMVGQTREVRERVAETKGASSGTSSSGGVRDTYDSDWDFDVEGETIGEMVASAVVFVTAYAVYTGFAYGQHAVLYHRDERPELVSLEGSLAGGFAFGENALMVTPKLRANYGLFASELRYINVGDVTGRMSSVDWQVVMLRLPIKSFKLEYGLGLSWFLSPNKAYFDTSAGFVWDLWDNRVQLEGRFRNSADTSVGRYRVEYSGDLGWEAARLGCFRLMPFAGYSKYTYFDDIDFSYLRLGLKLRWL